MNGKRENLKYRWFGWKSRKKTAHVVCLSCIELFLALFLCYYIHVNDYNSSTPQTRIHITQLNAYFEPNHLVLQSDIYFFLHVYPTASLYLSISLYHTHTHIRHRTILNIASTRARAKFINRYVRMAVNSMFRMWMDEHVCAFWNKCEQKMLTTTMDFLCFRDSRDEVLLIEQLLYVTHIIPYELQLSYFQCIYADFSAHCFSLSLCFFFKMRRKYA